jgi:large subunit ribosomal protein L25
MSQDLRLPVERRTKNGTAETRRLRQSGRVPANIYGRGGAGESVSVCAEIVEQLVATRSSVVDVELDGKVEKTIVREVQWDTFGTYVQHLDLYRVDPDAKATVAVPLEFRGDPVGLKDGGAIRQIEKTLSITCPDFRIPKSIVVRIGAMKVGDVLKASDVSLPEHAVLAASPDLMLIELVDTRKAG